MTQATLSALDQCTAIITGASSGLGAEFARQLASRAKALLLVARREAPMLELKQQLLAHNPQLLVEICICDLSKSAEWLYPEQECQKLGWQANLLINNAGLGDYGNFRLSSTERVQEMLMVNIAALTELSRRFANQGKFSAQHPAGIINISSLASTLPLPDLAVYAATKAYVSSLSEALAIELAQQHIQVIAICPGPTPTQFSATAKRADGTDVDRGGQDILKISPQQVVTESLQAFDHRQACHFPGLLVRVAATLFRLLPRVLLRLLLKLRYHRSQK